MPVLPTAGRLALTAPAMALLASVSLAQRPATAVSPRARPPVDTASTNAMVSAVAGAARLPQAARPSILVPHGGAAPLWAPLASLVVPGSGQLAMGQARGVAYAVAEVYTFLQVLEASRDAKARRAEYRRTAREVARSRFGGVEDGPWIYYEDMQDYVASGRYSLTPGGALTPETDTTTANGARWLKARRIYWDSVDVAPPRTSASYQNAIAFYNQRAWRDEFQWSWADQLVEWSAYQSTIGRRNQATRERTSFIGIILANHLLSAVDGVATVRLRRFTGAPGGTRYEVSLPWPLRR